jgi:hypothetical protein
MDVLLDLWKEYLRPILGPLSTSVPILQGVLLSLVTVIALMIVFRRRIVERLTAPDTRPHDMELFKKGDEIVNELLLEHLLNYELFNHWCDRDSIGKMGRFWREFQREENQFLDPEVRRAAHDLIGKLRELDNFTGLHFFRSPMNDDTYKLYPELRDHPNAEMRAQYWDRVPELNNLLDAAWPAYRKYRATVKSRLLV